MGNDFNDDFWRVCRAVSTKGRLRLLWLLFEEGELSVRELAAGTQITESYASFQLKVLFSAGLLRFRRQEMSVIYRAEATVRDERTVELLATLKECCEKRVSYESVIRQVTAFTHGRRIEIVRMLRDDSCSFGELMDQGGMTSSALSRNLLKLESRRVVWRDAKLYRLAQPSDRLGRMLLDIVCRKEV